VKACSSGVEDGEGVRALLDTGETTHLGDAARGVGESAPVALVQMSTEDEPGFERVGFVEAGEVLG